MAGTAEYLTAVNHEYETGIAVEHAYRPALKAFLESFDDELQAINDPKRSEIGAPDYIVQRGGVAIGIVEAKDIDVSLDRTAAGEQMGRYYSFGNVILTDYLEFRWYVGKEEKMRARVGKTEGKHVVPVTEGYADLESLIRQFLMTQVATIKSAQELAEAMAERAQQIRHFIAADLQSDDPSKELTQQMEAFKETLLPDLDIPQFADMYAQTVAYGLFAARVRFTEENPGADGTKFQRWEAGRYLPRTNPFLRKLFSNFSLDLGKRVTWLVDNLALVMAHADTNEILAGFGQATRQQDPVVHFYETFLAHYDAALREQRGVYYTPEPVVSYIVRSVDHILKTRFNRADGLADDNTLVLDPATGTGTFLYFVINHIHEQFKQHNMGAEWNSYVSKALLPRLFGFELLVAPYTVAHMKLGLLLQETGYTFESEQRLGVYLTNTLEETTKQPPLPFAQFITEEANAATAIKREKPIMVVLGNPPYSGHSANRSRTDNGEFTWIGKLIDDYYYVDGEPLGERNPKWLQDDYVKFIRFGQWRIEQTGEGVLAFVTNHGFLDNPTFRGMRQQLMNTFSDIYVLDMHGNAKKKEVSPDGSPDENVFDIQQGVTIGIFVKEKNSQQTNIYHYDLYGRRTSKYDYLLQNDIDNSDWEMLQPQSPFYLFTPQNIDLLGEYNKGELVTNIFPVNVLGFQTHRDKFAIDFEESVIKKRITHLREDSYSINELRETYRLRDNRDWKLADARKKVRNIDNWQDDITQCLYRPFDKRYCYFSDVAMDYPRRELIDNVYKRENIMLLVPRQTSIVGWRHVLVSQQVPESCAISTKTKEQNYVFPVYTYPDNNTLFGADDGSDYPLSDKGRRPNLSKTFVEAFAEKIGLTFVTEGVGDLSETFGPEAVFYYAYAMFHSPTYRERYAEFLKIDFPRLPLTSDVDLFRSLVPMGETLVQYHLLKHSSLQGRFAVSSITFNGEGDNVVSHQSRYRRYEKREKRVYINRTQYFEGIEAETWDFHIGGYQVLDKWLKDRARRALSADEITHYKRVVLALGETRRIMGEIDGVIGEFPVG